MKPDYSTVTELPGAEVIPLQIERSFHRYRFGVNYCEDKDVLEVACGGGQGLSLLAEKAKSVVGGDFDESNLNFARQTYKNDPKIRVVQMDAHHMPFPDNSFDTILIYEAIYYLKDPQKFINECRRLLRNGGYFIICTTNKNWPDFNPSPFTYHYFSIPELKELLSSNGFETSFYGAFPDDTESKGKKIRSLIKRMAVSMKLIPKTMKGKKLLKKIFYGKLQEMPSQLTQNLSEFNPPVTLSDNQIDTIHTAIYCVARWNPS